MEQFKKYLQTLAPITELEFESTRHFFKSQNLNKNEFFVKQDQICYYLAFIIKGTLRTHYLNNKGEETTACFCSENGFTTSYKSFILQQPSQLSIQALEDGELLVIDHASLQHLFSTSATWLNIGKIAIEQEYLVLEHYASALSNETAKEKYLRLLREQPSVVNKASVEAIASYLGVTRRTLSRIRQELALQ